MCGIFTTSGIKSEQSIDTLNNTWGISKSLCWEKEVTPKKSNTIRLYLYIPGNAS